MTDTISTGIEPTATQNSRGNAEEKNETACPVCQAALTGKTPSWWHTCASCGMEISTLEPAFDDRPMEEMFDWSQREEGIHGIRRKNFEKILDRLSDVIPPPAKLLDVGCAEGLFLQAAARRGYEAQGLEADKRMAGGKTQLFDDIRYGQFPETLAPDERFDVISFNDVFEHLPDVHAALDACHQHLSDNGFLLLNVPNIEGAMYRLSKVLLHVGFKGPFERMWQAEYPSPHLTYFSPQTLRSLTEQHGFEQAWQGEIPAVQFDGLWSRIRCDRSKSLAYSAFTWAGVAASIPFFAAFPSDICIQIFRRK